MGRGQELLNLVKSIKQEKTIEACEKMLDSIESMEDYTNTTATVNDIKKGKVAYAAGKRIVGEMPPYNVEINTEIDESESFNALNNLRTIYATDIDTSKYTSFSKAFQNLTNLKELKGQLNTNNVITLESAFDGCINLEKISFSNTGKITDWTKAFQNCNSLEEIENLNMDAATAVTYAFNGCTKLKSVPAISKTFTDYSYMFKNCENMEENPITTVPKISNLNGTFAGMKKITKVPDVYIPTTHGNIAYRNETFSGCENLETINVTAQSNKTNTPTTGMFKNCKKLKEVPACFNNFTFQSSSSSMFEGCESIKTIPSMTIGGSSNYQIARMFAGCTSLESAGPISVYISHTDPSRYNSLFEGCTNLKTVTIASSTLYGFERWFKDCINLEAVPEGLLDYTGTLYCTEAFRNSGIREIPANFYDGRNPGGSSSRRGDHSYIFADCKRLTTVPVLNLNCNYPTAIKGMFYNCPNLSDDSLNNIMEMFMKSALPAGYKYLSFYGIMPDQLERCKTLSNYEAFTAAGWTAT